MTIRYSTFAVFLAGLGAGWFGNSWYQSASPESRSVQQSSSSASTANSAQRRTAKSGIDVPRRDSATTAHESAFVPRNRPSSFSQGGRTATDASVMDTFIQLLESRRYMEAMHLYQQQRQIDSPVASRLKQRSLDHMRQLIEIRSDSDFSALTEAYLSFYYDDIDVLLLLADFNQVNSRYLEVVDVYMLAKTYAYNDAELNTVSTRFDTFLEGIDAAYSNQGNWWPLINLYSHVNTLGLMTPEHQYRQALAYLRAGDQAFAIEQLRALLSDALVGETAAQTLANLETASQPISAPQPDVSPPQQSIELERHRNQFLAVLSNGVDNSVRLLIDTGASMTAMSSTAFNTLNADGEAQLQDSRVFRTAGGLVMGTVYSFAELTFGPYQVKDVQVAVIDFDTGRTFDGLLGMNILGQFRFQIDQENSRLLLSR